MIDRAMIAVIRGYQSWISPMLPPACIYQPSCSHYASQAIQTHGSIRGGWLAMRRILRCHPFAKGGYDPVPGHVHALGCAHGSADSSEETSSSSTPDRVS
jgi:hypothetical protein